MARPNQLPLFSLAGSAGRGARRIGTAEVQYARVRDILTRATGYMSDYDFTLNPYSGCTFGCSYCYAAFFSHSASKRDTWGEWVAVKENAVERLQSRRGSLDGKLIYMSSVTDPYQPIERKLGLTRELLQILSRSHRPRLVVQTRSPDVVRDTDLFRAIIGNGGQVQVNVTITTDDEDVRRAFEPACPSNLLRLRAAGRLVAEGVTACITLTPLLLVRDAREFSESLMRTGVEDFIVQPFRFQRGKFVAGTRERAQRVMAEKLSCERGAFRDCYLEHYRSTRQVLREQLPRLGEGKEGFRPPF